ncbi:restriction endonuclease subunit S [Staphylococcus chromogenes]|uniref:restriction endonuclease subunit S n=1 Tax=Staphylococcus chromogenes TaxID=46126 RepID=UPI000D19A0BF|nr:restriction endonuclease subunit S [Staphylococcus chromogenes]PTF87457.1 restriction endonuclease subunit S [Staphylococcus chromogenes]
MTKTPQHNVPELRFPEFEGEWEEKKLGDIASFSKGKSLSKKDISENGVACILYGELYTKYNAFIDEIYSKTSVDKSTLVQGKENQILIPSSGETSEDIATASCLVSNKVVYIGGDINIITPKKDKGRFISLSLNSVNKNEIAKFAQGKSVVHLYNDHLKKTKIKIPNNLNEQEKIGTFFSKLDRQIELEEEKLEILEQQKRGYMQKIFSQELKFKNSQLENIKWSYKTLEELNSFFTDGNYGESYPKSEDMSDKNDGVAFLRGSNLKKGRITLEDANYISKKKHSELTTGHLFLDDIVIAVRGSLGAVGYVNENMVGNNINSQLAIIRTSNSLLYGKYLLYYLMSNQGKKELLSRVTGTALKQLPIKQIKQIKVPVPKLHEQHKIANFLSELDNLIDNQTEKIELLKQRKQGLLQKMFV